MNGAVMGEGPASANGGQAASTHTSEAPEPTGTASAFNTRFAARAGGAIHGQPACTPAPWSDPAFCSDRA
jgi:hypothetical protein